jgi:hypothetical protein
VTVLQDLKVGLKIQFRRDERSLRGTVMDFSSVSATIGLFEDLMEQLTCAAGDYLSKETAGTCFGMTDIAELNQVKAGLGFGLKRFENSILSLRRLADSYGQQQYPGGLAQAAGIPQMSEEGKERFRRMEQYLFKK